MSNFEGESPSSPIELCERLVWPIVKSTEAFFDPRQPHPFLKGLADGGIIHSIINSENRDLEDLTIVRASGLRDTLEPEKFPLIGIPEEVAANGLMWVVRTTRGIYPRNFSARPSVRDESLDHSFAYWDGYDWHTRRLIPELPMSDPWEDRWEESELNNDELTAVQAAAMQTNHLHQIAEQFGSDSHAFRTALLNTTEFRMTQQILDFGTINPGAYGSIARSTFKGHRAYMPYFRTGYQDVYHQLPVAHKLLNGQSYKLDSGGIMSANYHRSSLPSSPDMLEGGENIPFHSMHPPISGEMVDLMDDAPELIVTPNTEKVLSSLQ